MAKNDGILGIDVRHGKLSLSMVRGGKIAKTVWMDIPSNIVDDYKILSENLFSEFLKDKMKEHKIKAKKASFVINDTDLVIRSIDMPDMPDEQLRLNVPFEFSDYLSGDMKDYIFDFVKRKTEQKEAAGKVNLIAYAVPVEYVKKVCTTLRLAGLKLERAVPETLCYETLLGSIKDPEDAQKERCFLDIGSNHITMRIFKEGTYRLSHMIDIGENRIIPAIADELNVDINLAETYFRSNYQNCQECRGAMNAYKDISLEIIKGLNYYDMSDMTSRLRDVVLCGPGALTEPLVSLLKERIDKLVYTIQDMFPDNKEEKALNVSFASATVLESTAKHIGILESAAFTDVKKTDWKMVALGGLAAVVALAAVAKFGIIDKYDALNRAQAREAELQTRVTTDLMFINQEGDLSAEYYHYTWDDMTEEEKGRVRRVDVAKLADFIVSQGVSVRSLDLKESTLVVAVTGDSLSTMSKLTASLADQDIVASCSLSMAQTEDTENSAGLPRATASESSEEETAEETAEDTDSNMDNESEGETESDSRLSLYNSNNVVNAELKIYLATLNAENQGGDQ